MADRNSDNGGERTRMQCMEIWGGNQAIDKSFAAAGLDIHVHCQPFQDAVAGGDIYYLTSCASGRISRFLLADVSGHGDEAAGLAIELRDLLRKNVNKISQQGFVSAMNQKFGSLSGESGFATAVVATFFEPTQMLDISVAGHPYPVYYRAEMKRWVHLDPASGDAGFENMPLGVVQNSEYPGRQIKTEPDDMFLLYSDAFIEAFNDMGSGTPLGIKGFVDLLNESDATPTEVISRLRDKIGSLAEGNLRDDDASVILGHFTGSKVLLRDNLMAPLRLLGSVCDRTKLTDYER